MVLGKEHPSTLMSMNNLAEVLRHQGNYEQAEEMHRQALRLRETVLGKEHPEYHTRTQHLSSTTSRNPWACTLSGFVLCAVIMMLRSFQSPSPRLDIAQT